MDKSQLLSRFIVSLPDAEYKDANRLLYNVLQAQWYDERFSGRRAKPRTNMYQDGSALCKFGRWLLGSKEFPFTQQRCVEFFRSYFYQIPVCGAIIYRNASKKEWLTVKSPWSKRSGFPKGKMNHGESDIDCACREVYEETGVTIRHLIDEQAYVEYVRPAGRRVKFYIVVLDKEPAEMHSDNELEITERQWTPVDTPSNMYVVDTGRALDLLRQRGVAATG